MTTESEVPSPFSRAMLRCAFAALACDAALQAQNTGQAVHHLAVLRDALAEAKRLAAEQLLQGNDKDASVEELKLVARHEKRLARLCPGDEQPLPTPDPSR